MKKIICSVCLLIVSCSSPNQPTEDINTSELQEVIDQHQNDHPGVLGLLSAVQFEEKDIWRGASGQFDRGNSRELRADDAFQIGSITKVFISTIVLQLMEENKLHLDSTITTYLSTEIRALFNDVQFFDEIKVRNLLNHSSGIYNYTNTIWNGITDNPTRQWTPVEILGVAAEQSPVFEPGTIHAYSNSNFIFLGLIIEYLSGKPVNEVLKERIYDRIDLKHTYFAEADSKIGELAHAYEKNVDGSIVNMSMAFTAGAMVSTTDDLIVFIKALVNGELFENSETFQEMIKASSDGFGLGIFVSDDPDSGPIYFHTGGTIGYVSFLLLVKDQQTAVSGCFMLNNNQADIQLNDLLIKLINKRELNKSNMLFESFQHLDIR